MLCHYLSRSFIRSLLTRIIIPLYTDTFREKMAIIEMKDISLDRRCFSFVGLQATVTNVIYHMRFRRRHCLQRHSTGSNGVEAKKSTIEGGSNDLQRLANTGTYNFFIITYWRWLHLSEHAPVCGCWHKITAVISHCFVIYISFCRQCVEPVSGAHGHMISMQTCGQAKIVTDASNHHDAQNGTREKKERAHNTQLSWRYIDMSWIIYARPRHG